MHPFCQLRVALSGLTNLSSLPSVHKRPVSETTWLGLSRGHTQKQDGATNAPEDVVRNEWPSAKVDDVIKVMTTVPDAVFPFIHVSADF